MNPSASPGTELLQRLEAGSGPVAEVVRPGLRVRLHTTDRDRLGILVKALEFDRLRGDIQAADLRRRLERLAAGIDYLSEKLRLVEHDPAHTGALLRSAQVRRDGPDREYFELRVERNRDTLFNRLRQPPEAGERSQVPFLLTREILVRLVDDLAAALRA